MAIMECVMKNNAFGLVLEGQIGLNLMEEEISKVKHKNKPKKLSSS